MTKFPKNISLGLLSLWIAQGSQAQELDNFLGCAQFTDRMERVICLEEALDAASAAEEASNAAIEEGNAGQGPASNAAVIEEFGLEQEVETSAREMTAADAPVEEKSGFRLPIFGGFFGKDKDEDEEVDVVMQEADPSNDQLNNFGRKDQSRIVENADGEEELFDVVADLEMGMPNMWLIRLASGQVWRQVDNRRFNLRKGDSVRIYPSGWGDDYRLATERLSGFIQVSRVQ